MKRLLFLNLQIVSGQILFKSYKYNMKTFLKIFPISLLIIIVSCTGSGNRTDITVKELRNHIKYLSSDSLKGRMTGSTGDSLAAEYIKTSLSSYGLVPIEGDGLERCKINDIVLYGKHNSLSINDKKFTPETNFAPMAFSENDSVGSGVVFAGYGFSIDNDSVKWDDYKGLNVKGKWVMILRADPEPDNSLSKYSTFSGDRDKSLHAKDMGASGVLLVSGSSFDKEDILDPLAKGEFSVGIPVFRIKRNIADVILSKSGNTIDELEKQLNTRNNPHSFATGVDVNARSEIIQHMTNTRNVVMLLPGDDPRFKDEYLIFGAHFDHLGMGGPGSSSRKPDTVAVHHGADDNASGVAMLIELAGKFAGTRDSHKKSLIFLSFSGEELGILGSKYYADHPEEDLSKTEVMINLDMVGRLKETKDLQIGGVGTADGLKDIASGLYDTNKLKIAYTEEGSGPSDHSAFYAKDVPVLFFTTGAHEDYHTPSDTWDKINYDGMLTVADLIYKIASHLANDTAKLVYKEAGPKGDVIRVPRRRGVTLGIMPDFAGVVKNGLRADLVTPGRPAALGGMKKGDIIVSINGQTVNNIEDYMYRMSQLKHGQTISVEVMRDDKKLVLIIQI